MDSTAAPVLDEARAKRDGCGCPEFVLKCVHFDGVLLLLTRPVGCHPSESVAYYAMGEGEIVPCWCGHGQNARGTGSVGLFRSDALAEAEAEFSRREALLRTGEMVQ